MRAQRRDRRKTVAPKRSASAVGSAPTDLAGQTGADAEPQAASQKPDPLWLLLERVIAPTTLLVALATHFGRQYTSARSAYFGIDVSLLGFSTQDYVVRSADALFIPLGALALASLLCVEIDGLACRVVDRAPPPPRGGRLRLAVRGLRIIGALLLALGIYAALYGLSDQPHYLVPLLPGVGILLIALGTRLHQRWLAHPRKYRPPPHDIKRKALVGAIVVVSLFWTATEYAKALGTGRSADQVAMRLEKLPIAVVYSHSRLLLSGPGVHERALTDPQNRYRFRYDGLRLVIRSGGAYFLLPDGWTQSDGAAIVLSESSGVRFEFPSPHTGGEK